jgi:hypothetical protein
MFSLELQRQNTFVKDTAFVSGDMFLLDDVVVLLVLLLLLS